MKLIDVSHLTLTEDKEYAIRTITYKTWYGRKITRKMFSSYLKMFNRPTDFWYWGDTGKPVDIYLKLRIDGFTICR